MSELEKGDLMVMVAVGCIIGAMFYALVMRVGG